MHIVYMLCIHNYSCVDLSFIVFFLLFDQYPPAYGTTVHLNYKEGHYHIPATNYQWLCVRKTAAVNV